jgi:hypothetical protein
MPKPDTWYLLNAKKNACDLLAEGITADVGVAAAGAMELCAIMRCAYHAHGQADWPPHRKITADAIEQDIFAWRTLAEEASERQKHGGKAGTDQQHAKTPEPKTFSRLVAEKLALDAMRRRFGLGPDWKPPTD